MEHVSREVGISVATLERWRADALANGSGTGSLRWTAAARLQAVIITAAMDEATRSAWCREQGLYPAELDAWKRDAIAGLGEPRAASAVEARQDRRSGLSVPPAFSSNRAFENSSVWRGGSFLSRALWGAARR